MAIEKVREYFKRFKMDDRILEFDSSSATVSLAAKALNTEEERIAKEKAEKEEAERNAKSLTFRVNDEIIMIVMAGDAKVDNHKFKDTFHKKGSMLQFDEVETLIGHAVGGVCPFAINEGVKVYLDESLKRFDTVFPACGSPNSAIELKIKELEIYSNYSSWVDISTY